MLITVIIHYFDKESTSVIFKENTMVKKWELKKSEKVLENKWLTVRNNTYKLPNGEVRDKYYTIEKLDYVAVFAENDNGEVMTIQNYRWGVDEVLTEIPAGLIDEGESPKEAAIRSSKKRQATN